MTAGPTLGDLGEIEALRRLLGRLAPGRDVATGPGDDCAIVRAGDGAWDWALTTDPLIEGVHFPPGAPPAAVGHKAVGRVLSDLAATGAEPCWLLVDLVAPPGTPVARLERCYEGAGALAARHGAAIVGGDLARGPALELHVFGVGRVPRGTAVLRSGARPGDLLYVTGALGGRAAGGDPAFEPRVREGAWLREGGWAGAMMDVSDGIGTDLPRMARASGTGAEVDGPAVPVSGAARAAAGARTPLERALRDGEDFELLFTVRPDRRAAFERAWRAAFELACTRIGRVTDRAGEVLLVDAAGARGPLGGGYEHFAPPAA